MVYSILHLSVSNIHTLSLIHSLSPPPLSIPLQIGFRGPIIGVSGGDELTMKQFLEAGANNVMQKPAQSDKLMSMLLSGLQTHIR